MKLDQIRLAVREGLPFEITTAADDKFEVSEANQIAYSSSKATWVSIVTAKDDLAHIVPLAAVTSLTTKNRPNK